MRHGPNNQRGVALIVALVILVLVTIAGVATMESTGMELKMSNADQDHQQAFEEAETALRIVESKLQHNSAWIDFGNLYSDCSGSSACFNINCDNGLCFRGEWYSYDNDPTRCTTVSSSLPTPVIPPWYNTTWTDGSTQTVWDNAGKHRLVPAPTGYTNDVKYIVEFRCFVPKNPNAPLQNNAAELFRITVRAKSNSGNAVVMLQSTYKVL